MDQYDRVISVGTAYGVAGPAILRSTIAIDRAAARSMKIDKNFGKQITMEISEVEAEDDRRFESMNPVANIMIVRGPVAPR